jgi:hypothetical protein
MLAEKKEVELPASPELREQVGPSCWACVLSAIAKSWGFDTDLFDAALLLYPENDDLTRTQSLQALINTLEQCKSEIEHATRLFKPLLSRIGAQADKEAFLGLVMRYLKNAVSRASVTNCVNTMTSGLSALLQILKDKDEYEGQRSEERILGGARANFNTAEVKDAQLMLLAPKLPFPLYMFTYRRLPNKPPANAADCDWTKVSKADVREFGYHALLLTKATEAFIQYKDPNYGNVEIRISWDVLLDMASKPPPNEIERYCGYTYCTQKNRFKEFLPQGLAKGGK